MTNINSMRDEIQQKAKEAIDKNDAVLLEFGTGIGKTKIALDACNGLNTLIVYKQLPHYKNWLDEIKKWNIDSSRFIFTTYNSLFKYENNEYDYLIFDEAHAITELKLKSIKTIKATKTIYLSATVEYEKKALLREIGKFKTCKFTLNEAIENNVLPDVEVFIHQYRLDDKRIDCVYERVRKTDKQVITIPYADRYKYLSRKGIGLNILCTQRQYYGLLCEEIEFWKKKYYTERNDVFKNIWLNKASMRKKWVNTIKTEYAKTLLTSLQNRRIIVFANTIAQCDELANDYQPNYPRVHSKVKRNQETVDRFNNFELDRLYNCSVLNEGMNLTQLDDCVIVGIDGKELSTIQRIGRSIRSTDPKIHIIKALDTKDAEYVENIISQYKKVSYVY